MKASVVRFAAGVALVGVCVPLPATGQYFPPVMIIVPPAQNYAVPKPALTPTPDKPKPAEATSPEALKGHYQGRTFIPDK